ncbi:MAG: hypothetical protein WCU00_12945 [Candidatus Latescibacterota bacterium]
MPSIPKNDGKIILAPHVVILGAGASKAAFPEGEANGLQLPLMQDFIDIVGLTDLLKKDGIDANNKNFENIYDDLFSEDIHKRTIKKIEEKVYNYFSLMKLPESLTIYDYLVLSLRETDMIATFNWDPFLAQAYNRNKHVGNMPQIAFLHGNVGIGLCERDKGIGFIDQLCIKCNSPLQPTKLLYPIKHKDYENDIFIKDQWNRLRQSLNFAYYITIFGYSAPTTDVEAKQLMIEVWNENPTKEFAEIEIVDIKHQKELIESWNDFIVRHHYATNKDIFFSYLFTHPRRSCDAFFSSTLQNEPWKDNPYPKFDTLDELHRWIQPLILEERKYQYLGEKFSRKPCPSLKP